MRIVQVVADGRPGGGTALVLDLVQACRAAGAEVHLVTDRASYAAAAARDAAAANGAAQETVHELPFFRPGLGRSPGSELAACLGRLDPDVVHVHGSRAVFFAGPLAPRFPRAAFHYTVHGYHFEHRLAPRRWLGRAAERSSTRHLRSWVHVCRYDRDLGRARRLLPAAATSRIIPNGVDTDRLAPRDPAGSPPDAAPRGVAFVGRLIPQKDPLLAAEILARLAHRGVPARMIGGGELEGRVRRYLTRKHPSGAGIELSGAVAREVAQEQLARSAVVVLPSRWEGLPIALLEAMALGVAVVAAPVGGVPEVVEHEATGILVSTRRPEAWVEAVERLLADGVLRRRLVEAARRRVEERFSWQLCRAAYLELYGLPGGSVRRA